MRRCAFRWFCVAAGSLLLGIPLFGPGRDGDDLAALRQATNRRTWGIRKTGVRGTC